MPGLWAGKGPEGLVFGLGWAIAVGRDVDSHELAPVLEPLAFLEVNGSLMFL